VRGKTRFRRDGETTRERRTGGDGSTLSVGEGSWTSTGREGPRRGCARRERRAAATSSRVVGDFEFGGGYELLLYLERGAREGAEGRMKAS
jgi:hypothetical protein